jgi:SAM-dependent methyltransferase
MALARKLGSRTQFASIDPVRLRGADWALFKSARRRELVRTAWRYWRAFGFPHYQLSKREISLEFFRLAAQDPRTAFSRHGALGSVVGLRLANFFQPGMWSVRVSRYRSPMDVFQDDDLLKAAIERAWTIWPDRCGANSSTLRRMLKTFPSTASVSNFRPTLARAVIERYSAPGATVVDFSAGFGGRLTGCLTLDRKYIGIEPDEGQVAGLRSNISALAALTDRNAAAEIIAGCAEDLLPQMPSRSAGLVFSSPPYYNWERYSDSPQQSFIRYGSYDAWLDGFLEPCIRESRRILRRRGRLVLNISGRSRWPSAEDVIRIAKRSHFRLVETMPMLLARVPYLHPRNGSPYKPELLLVFEQRVRR